MIAPATLAAGVLRPEPTEREGVDGLAGPKVDDVRVHSEPMAPSAATGAGAKAGTVQ